MCVGFSFNYTKKFFCVTLNIEFAYYQKYIKGKEIIFSLSHRITKKGEGHFNNKQICARALVFIILVLIIIIIIIIVASKL
jgi:hypothetical protein